MRAKITNRLVDSLKPRAKAYEVADTELKGLTLRVQPSGYMGYYVRYKLPTSGTRGRYRMESAAAITPMQARDFAKEIIANAMRGIDPQDTKREARANDLGTFLDEVYKPWAKEHRKGGAAYVARVKACFPELLNKSLSEIKVFWIENWRIARLKDGKKPGTVNRDIATLRAVLSRAVDSKLLKEHPLATLRPMKEDSAAKVRYLSDAEGARLMAALDARQERQRQARDDFNKFRSDRGYSTFPDLRQVAYTDHLKPMVLLSLHTGLRRGELFSLVWEDVNLASAMLTVEGQSAKSGNTRHVPLTGIALDVLKTWKTQGTGKGLVFKSSRGGGAFDNVNNSWRALLTVAKIEKFRWHDMRHDFASKLVIAGVDLNTVRELLGHADMKMTLRYAHLSPAVKANAVAMMEKLWTNIEPLPVAVGE